MTYASAVEITVRYPRASTTVVFTVTSASDSPMAGLSACITPAPRSIDHAVTAGMEMTFSARRIRTLPSAVPTAATNITSLPTAPWLTSEVSPGSVSNHGQSHSSCERARLRSILRTTRLTTGSRNCFHHSSTTYVRTTAFTSLGSNRIPTRVRPLHDA